MFENIEMIMTITCNTKHCNNISNGKHKDMNSNETSLLAMIEHKLGPLHTK